ncbi:tyrosine-protein phosphatase [Paenalcaligenes sp.]|uniref:tyrosine-protein phosphatase n=1 Tax=Paenalcaligenes sp. TaxID=1966342 RepID=UPI002613926E|nr:tyrosine-protein phosphatase [Paenalcaligenes sp.]
MKMTTSYTFKKLITNSLLAVAMMSPVAYLQAAETAPSAPSQAALHRTVTLEKADNFRDLAGEGTPYQTTSGKKLKSGVIFRSNALELSDSDIKQLSSLNIRHIYDLRTPGEIALHPDTEIPGAKWENRNLLGWDDVESVRTGFTERPEKTIAGAEEIYRLITNDEHARKEIGTLLNQIAENDGAQIVHCSGGKDRTGWVSAILLHIAGVPRDVIMNDFLLSNDYSLQSITESFNKTASQKGVQAALAFAPFMGVQENWLEISFNEAEKNYGSMDEYITKGLNVSPETQQRIKAKLVE